MHGRMLHVLISSILSIRLAYGKGTATTGKGDRVADIQNYPHPDFFYLNENGEVVFTAANKAMATPNSSNARRELRQMLPGTNTDIGAHAAGNNFALQANPAGEIFGGKLNATLKVNHVAERVEHPEK